MQIKAMGDSAEILLYDEIGESFFGGYSAKDFATELASVGNVSEIHLRINSPGGSVFDGFAMYNTLKRHPARVVVDIDGMALSIASVIAMAGDEIRMAENAQMMIHNPYTVVAGTSKDMRDTADILDSLKDGILSSYANHSNLNNDALSAAMDAETWYNAEEAIAAGLAHSEVKGLKIAAHFDLSDLKNGYTLDKARNLNLVFDEEEPQVDKIEDLDNYETIDVTVNGEDIIEIPACKKALGVLDGLDRELKFQKAKAKLI
jgi:ATP-dependent protease ClpP protease subunit